jgi:TonB family protein
LYDRRNNRKYGPVDFRPILQKSNEQELTDHLLLAQNANPSDTSTTKDLSTEILTTTSSGDDTTSPNISQVLSQELAEMEKDDLSPNLDKAMPLIASSSPSSQIIPTSNKVPAQQIDYDQTFIELFLDGGKKEYKSKPRFKITNVLKNVLEPGEIRIRVIVARSGKVDQATILKGLNDILDQAILETVKKYRYKNGTVNGQPVKFTTSEVFRFE